MSVKHARSWRQVPHDDRCRDRIGELIAGDDDQRQIERVTSRATVDVENEIPCPETGEEVDVGEPSAQPRSVDEDQPRPETQSFPRPVEEQPIPTVRVGGSSGSRTRSGVGSRASETNTDDREVKRVRFTESRGQKRQGEDVEEVVAKAEEQHLDADVEVPAQQTWRVEDVADAADAAPEQVNSFVQSKTEVFEKIEESLRPLCMVEDLDDNEIMELCILSDELNACEATAILNPLKFASCATRLGLRSLEDDKAELRRVQNREQPELLVGSPPSDEFSSFLNTCVEARELVYRVTSCKWKCEKTSCMNILKFLVLGKCLEVQSVINDSRVYSIDGPMCRWSLRTRGLKNKTEFMRKRTRWLTSSKEIAEVLRGDGRWKRDKRFVHMTGKSETESEYPASLVVAMLKTIKRQMISDGVIRIGEMHFAGPVPHESDNHTELESKCGVDGTCIDPKLLIAGRKEEMECMMKMGVFEVVDEKECYDNGCKPLMLK